MKKTKLILTALAFVAGIGGAFATKIIGDSQSYFYLDPDTDEPVTKVNGSPACAASPDDCAQLYNVDVSGNPTTPAGNIIHGTRQ